MGGLIGAGVDNGVQLYNMQPTSLGHALRCLNWGEVGVSFGAGTVVGLTGFTIPRRTITILQLPYRRFLKKSRNYYV